MNLRNSRWFKVTFAKGICDAEQLVAVLLPWGLLGLQETDTHYEVYFAFSQRAALPRLMETLREQWPEIDADFAEITDDGWSTRWQEYFKPQRITHRIAVRPLWERPQNVDVEIVLQPGMAFGTGTHATTRLALQMLEKFLMPGMSVLDAGCGSGILAIAALKLGAGSVVAWDIDPEVVDNFTENLSLNNLAGKIDIHIGDVTQLPDYGFNLIISNIERQPNLRLLDALALHKNRSLVIFTGLLQEECTLFTEAVLNYGREIVAQDTEDEWLVLVVH